MSRNERATLASIAVELRTSAMQLRPVVDRAFRTGNALLAYTKTAAGYVYDREAVRAAWQADRIARPEVCPAAVPLIEAAAARSAQFDARKARRIQRRIEGQNAKANRRAAKARQSSATP